MPLHLPSTTARPRIAIIGAGMTGLRCDQRLREHGWQATVCDKSRGSSGRMSPRRIGDALRFDHGAQYVTAHDEGFARWLHERQAEGAAAVWQPQLPADAHRPSHDWWIGTPEMADLLRNALDVVTTEPCWALMLDFATPLALDFDAQRLDDNVMSWLARQGSRPGATTVQDNAWTMHASAHWSKQHRHAAPEQVSVLLQRELAHLIGAALPACTFAQAHRWLYARTRKPLEQALLCNDDASLFVGGNCCLGARVEYAFLSGSAMAEKIIESRRALGE